MAGLRSLVPATLAVLLLGVPARDAQAARRAAVVVGVSAYDSLPSAYALPSAGNEARALAAYLKGPGGYDRVILLVDAEATRAAVVSALLEKGSADLQPGDTLLFAFVGQGAGGDFGDPALLTVDAHIDDIERTALRVYDLAPRLASRLAGVNFIAILDAAHDGQVDGVALLGPSANDFPATGKSFALSAGGPGEASTDGLFMPLVLSGLSGEADTNADGEVTAAELYRHLVVAVPGWSEDRVHPAESGNYDRTLVVATVGVIGDARDPGVAGGPVFGGPVSYALMGGGAAVIGGAAVYGQLRGRALCDVQPGGADCVDDEHKQAYERTRLMSYVGYGVGGVLVAAGVGVGFVPLDGGAQISLRGQF